MIDEQHDPMAMERWNTPVSLSDSAKAGIEKTQLFSTTSAIFRACCLLNAD
jgi:hypothetical protein